MGLEPRGFSNSSFSTPTFYCWAEDPREPLTHEDVISMGVDWDVVDHISRLDVDYPVGICPNPDIAGSLLRIAHYITAFCLIILIFHAPKRVKDTFYYQMSTVYALLITCSVSLFQQNITRFHAKVAIFIASSLVSFYFLVYSIRAFWDKHQLDTALGKKYLNCRIVFLQLECGSPLLFAPC